jgi:hypothetical protein
MVARLMVVVTLLSSAVLLVCGPVFAGSQAALERPGIVDLDSAILIDRDALGREMRLNVELSRYIDLYGWPDYAEIQEVELQEPFAPYEVRLYYLKQNSYLAYGRVHIAPSINDFGMRKFAGPIPPATLNRLLTASLERARQEAAAAEAARAAEEAVVEVDVVEVDVVDDDGMDSPVEPPAAVDEAPADEPVSGEETSEAEMAEDTLS